jgi:hypothetical protein
LSSLLERLRLGRGGRQTALAELRQRTKINLGPDPARWLHWLELGRWLDDAQRTLPPPRAKGNGTNSANLIERAEFSLRIQSAGLPPSARLVGLVLEGLFDAPDDAACWLALGRLLDLDGAHTPARAALERGAQLALQGLSKAPQLAWDGLVRYLAGGDRRRFSSRWIEVCEKSGGVTPWASLMEVLAQEPDLRVEVLRRSLERPSLSEAVAPYLMKFELDDRDDPQAAREVLMKALQHHPRSAKVAGLMFDLDIRHGRLSMLPQLASLLPDDDDRRAALPYWLGDLSRSVLREGGNAHLSLSEAQRLLERGELRAAERLLAPFAANPLSLIRRGKVLLFEIVGAGSREAWALAACRTLIENGPGGAPWFWAAGACSHPSGHRTMEELLAAGGSEVDQFRALWFSRRGLFKESLAVLEECWPVRPPVAAEIITRPLWMALMGMPVANDVLVRARAATLRQSRSPGLAALVTHVCHGRTGEALQHARTLMALEKEHSFPWLTLAWATACADPAQLPEVQRSARVSIRHQALGGWMIRELDAIRVPSAISELFRRKPSPGPVASPGPR